MISNNKRIAKNTALLYLRQLFSMVVALYTVRVVLDVLGAEDYGIYNVTGSLVVLFSFVMSTMATATQRFLSYEIGKNDITALKNVFTQSLISYAFIVLAVVLMSETIGLWFLNNKLVIPDDRMFAANVMYQFAILSFVVNVINAPYNAAVIAMERMDVFAYGGVASSILNLVAVLILQWVKFSDALIAYAVFLFLITLIIASCYIYFCYSRFEFCRIRSITKDMALLKEMTAFAFWNMIGTISNLLRNQGVNMLINMFFNPVVNAARAIAMQVSNAISSFSYNFYTAVRPQLVKYYSSGQNEKMLELGYQSSRFSFLLLFVITVPIFCEADGILHLWLKEVPDSTVLFVRIILITSLVEILTVPLDHMMQASGQIKNFLLIISIINVLNIPASYLVLKFGYAPESTMYICLVLLVATFVPRLIICKCVIRLSYKNYLLKVIMHVLLVFLSFIAWYVLFNLYKVTLNLFILLFLHMIVAIIIIALFGLCPNDRFVIWNLAKNKVSRKNIG